MARPTVPSLDLTDTSALDDADVTEEDALTNAWSAAVARAIGRAEREERRSRGIARTVAAKRAATADAYEPIPEEIQAFLSANPAF